MREVHAEHRVAGLKQRHVHRDVGVGARVGLYIGKRRIKQLLRALSRDVFYEGGIRLAAVVALARIAFAIFVGKYRALRLAHGFRNVVFAGYQFEPFALARLLPFYRLKHFFVLLFYIVVIHSRYIHLMSSSSPYESP